MTKKRLHTIIPQRSLSSIKKQILFEIVSKLEVKILMISDELSENYKTCEKQWFINNNLINPTNEDVKNNITADCIKKKMDIISKLKIPLKI